MINHLFLIIFIDFNKVVFDKVSQQLPFNCISILFYLCFLLPEKSAKSSSCFFYSLKSVHRKVEIVLSFSLFLIVLVNPINVLNTCFNFDHHKSTKQMCLTLENNNIKLIVRFVETILKKRAIFHAYKME